MRITNINIKNFKSIKDLSLSFDNDIVGLWKLSGNTGAGKTSVGEAILFGLFGDIKGKKKDSLIRWGESSASVEIEIISKSRKINIFRSIGKGSKFNVLIDNVPIDFTNKNDIQTQLEEDYFDVSRNTIESLCLISFNNFRSIIRMSASDTREFIDKTFGLQLLTDYNLIIKDKIKTLNNELQSKQQELKIILGKIDEIEKTKTQISSEDDCEKKIQEANDEIENLVQRANVRLSELKQEAIKITEDLNKAKTEFSDAISNEAAIRSEGQQLAKKINLISSGKCPVCEQSISETVLSSFTSEKAKLGEKWNTANELLKTTKETLDKTTSTMNENIALVNKINMTLNAKVNEIKNSISKYKKEIELKEYLNKNTEDFVGESEKIKAELIDIEKIIIKWTDLTNILNIDVRSNIINQMIPMINAEIANLCVKLNQPYFISLTPNFDVDIRINGLDVPISSLSTGQSKTLDMMVIFAIIKTFVNKIPFNVFFLDELFSNMDFELRNSMCEALNEISENKTIFVLSHADVQNRYFNGAINATINNRNEFGFSEYEISEFSKF